MKIKNYKCKKCGRDNFIMRIRSSFYGLEPIRVDHYGIYCSYCGKWLKWADKGERLLFLEDGKNEDN